MPVKTILAILTFLGFASSVSAQHYYLRGEVKDEGGNSLQNVSILHHTTGYVFRTGSSGSFGIPTTREIDTLTFSYDGYHNERKVVKASQFIEVKMKLMPATASTVKRNKLSSLTKDLSKESAQKYYAGDESYASLVENDFVNAEKYPTTGIALNIDKASYSNIRRFVNLGMAVPPDAVRLEEMLNYFNFDFPEPDPGQVFRAGSVLTDCPWNPDNHLFYVNIASKRLNVDSLPPSNFVFLIDISGSMDMPNRLPLVKSAFHMLAKNLREKDTVSIVIYGGAVGIMLNPTSGKEKEKIARAIDDLIPGGSTPGESGIRIAYNIARNHFKKDGNNRVILATDGDFNVGAKTEQELEDLITRNRQSGIYLTCLGVGMGNYKDSKIQTLARKGNGNFAYLDSYHEAEKMLMKEFTQTLYTVADDVYMNISFDADLVKSYRLIGFDNKVGALADTSSTIEGGEIGSGHTLMAAFEVALHPNAPSRPSLEEFANIMISYREPGIEKRLESKFTINYDPVPYKDVEPMYRFATSLIMFGSLLKNSDHAKHISWGDVIYQASESANTTDVNQHQFVELVIKAKNLYSKFKKRKR